MTGRELRAAIAERGRTQREFAEHIAVSPRQVVRWCKQDAVPRYVELVLKTLPRRVLVDAR
jgi:transcriptional regulator with XRE-family HTH domain